MFTYLGTYKFSEIIYDRDLEGRGALFPLSGQRKLNILPRVGYNENYITLLMFR